MYNCQNCDRPSKPREALNVVVTKTRVKFYTNINEEGEPVKSQGEEIVKEVGVCNECKRRYDEIHGKQK